MLLTGEETGLPLGYHYTRTFGKTGEPYPPVGQEAYLNRPNKLFVGPGDKLYATEGSGQRFWGFSTASVPGVPESWAPLGVAGVGGNMGDPNTQINSPEGIGVDFNGYIWMTNWWYVSIIDPVTGNFVTHFNMFDTNGFGHNNQFDCLSGLALESNGLTDPPQYRLYVSERCGHNNDVLVLDITNPYDDATRTAILVSVIQAPGVYNHNDILLTDLGAGKRLLVAWNDGVAAFAETAPNTWTVEAQMGNMNANGLGANPTDPNFFYVVGHSNGPRIWRCDAALNCGDYIATQDPVTNERWIWNPLDIAFDSAGDAYITDEMAAQILHYSNPALPKEAFYGVQFKPYTTPLVPDPDGLYDYNSPSGLGVDPQGNVYILEEQGSRLTKLNAAGEFQWAYGEPGRQFWSEQSEGFNNPRGSVAFDAQGWVYVPDRNNGRVMILDSAGNYLGLMGQQNQPEYRMDCPSGVAIGENGDIFVVDECMHAVQVYNSSRFFRSVIGTRWEWGTDDAHLNNPRGIALLDDYHVLIADGNNGRVQKCTRFYGGAEAGPGMDPVDENWQCSTFLGTTGEQNNTLYQFGQPSSVAYDALNQRILVGDEWSNGAKVFDLNGKLIELIGERNDWGNDQNHFSQVSALAVDAWGNLYVADRNNHRVQKYIPAIDPVEYIDTLAAGIERIAISGTRMYADMGTKLGVFSLSNPASPTLLGVSQTTGANIGNGLAASGNWVYANAEDNSLRAFNASDPANPVEEFLLPMSNPQGMALRGNYLFVGSCCTNGAPVLNVFDIQTPDTPTLIARYQMNELANQDNYIQDMVVDNPAAGQPYHIYVAANYAGILRVEYDPVSNTVVSAGHFNDGGQAVNLAASTTNIFALDRHAGDGSGHFHRITAATMVGNVQLDTNLTNSVEFLNGYVYIHNWKSMQVYSNTDFSAPVATYDAPENLGMDMALVVSGTPARIYTSSNGIGLMAFTFDPAADPMLNLTGEYHPPSFGGFLEAYGSQLIMANWDSGWRVIDTANPANLQVQHLGAREGVVNRLTVFEHGGQPYVVRLDSCCGAGNNHLTLFALNNPSVKLADTDTATPGGFNQGGQLVVKVRDANSYYVFVPGANGGLLTYTLDFTNPTNIVFNAYDFEDYGWGAFGGSALLYTNRYLLTANDGQPVRMIDVNDPANPLYLGDASGENVRAISVVGSRLYGSSESGRLVVYDLAKVATPPLDTLGTIGINDWVGFTSVSQFGDRVIAYLANGNRGMRMLDVTDPANMWEMGWARSDSGWYYTNQAIGPFVYQTAFNNGLLAVWAPPYTEKVLASDGVLDSSGVDGIRYEFASTRPQFLTLLHMPVFQGKLPDLPAGVTPIGHAFAAFARDSATDQPVTEDTFTLSLQYGADEIGSLIETSLSFYYLDGSTWVKEISSAVDPDTNTLTATPGHFSVWAVGGMETDVPTAGALQINGGDAFTKQIGVTLDLTYSADVEVVRFKENCPTCGWTDWLLPEAQYSWALSAGDGEKTVDAELRDLAHNVLALSDTIILDTTPPTGAITINEVSPTNQGTLHLTITSDLTLGAGQMMFSEDPAFGGAVYQPFATSATFAVSAGDGVKTVYARFMDAAGNETSAEISDSVTVDRTAPDVDLYINGGAAVTTSRDVVLTIPASDALSGVTQMVVSSNPDFGEPYVAYSPVANFTLPAGDGSKTVYVQVRDAAGNFTNASDTITLDSTAPAGSVTLNLKPFTSTTAVNLALTGGDATQMRIANTSTFTGVTWGAFAASRSWTLTSGDGPKNVYAQFEDAHGNRSEIVSDATLLDTTAPTGTLFINGGAGYTAVSAVKLFVAFSEAGSGVAQYRMAESSAALTTAPWTTFANPIDFTLAAGDGSKTVYMQLRDAAGNISAEFSDAITVDSTAPTGSLAVSGGPDSATLTLTASDAVWDADHLQMQVSTSSDFAGAAWQPFQTSLDVPLTSREEVTFYVRFRDGLGNLSPVYEATLTFGYSIYLPMLQH